MLKEVHFLPGFNVLYEATALANVDFVPVLDKAPHTEDGRIYIHMVEANPNLMAIDFSIDVDRAQNLKDSATCGLGLSPTFPRPRRVDFVHWEDVGRIGCMQE